MGLVAQTVEVLGEDLQVLGQTHGLQVVGGDELLAYPVKRNRYQNFRNCKIDSETKEVM